MEFVRYVITIKLAVDQAHCDMEFSKVELAAVIGVSKGPDASQIKLLIPLGPKTSSAV
jgi:hypothetical protein